jgi:lysophospholipase L1-like esterase
LFGAALKASGKKPAVALLRTRGYAGQSGHVSELTLYYLKQPGGGHVRVMVDGKRMALLSTAGKSEEAGYLALSAPLGQHEIELKTQGDGPVTLFGLTLDQKGPGVIVDTLGIPGARAKFHLLWDEPLYREHLLKRNPDLVVLAYGTNEAGDEDLSPSDYEQTLRRTVLRIKGYLPHVSCLLVGPTDRPEQAEDGSLHTRDQLYGIVAVQRRLAKELGCAFFDVAQAMGGPMSIVRLAAQTPPLAKRDYVHLTSPGYEALGDALLESLLVSYGADTLP